jgi:hypothetical protein
MVAALTRRGAVLELPAGGTDAALAKGLRALTARGIVQHSGEILHPVPEKLPLLRFYAASVQQALDPVPDSPPAAGTVTRRTARTKPARPQTAAPGKPAGNTAPPQT